MQALIFAPAEAEIRGFRLQKWPFRLTFSLSKGILPIHKASMKDKTIHFDDVEVVRSALKDLEAKP